MEEQSTGLGRLRWAILAIVGLILLSLLAFLLFQDRNDSANLKLVVVPDDATVTIDGQSSGPGLIELPPGEHTIVAEKEGFETLSQTVDIGPSLETVAFALTPVSEEAKAWAQENQDKYLEVESIAGTAANQEGEAFQDRYPLTARLPYDAVIYRIDYVLVDDNNESVVIRVKSEVGPAGRQVALEQIRQWGFEPSDYEFVFPNLGNPFEEQSQGVDNG